jgi:short-subunit dehydrogenase
VKAGTDSVVTVVITGASAGVGRATARVFAERGAALGLIARGQEGLDATVKEMSACGVQAIAISADVADASAVEEAAERLERELGPIDVWVNNAMVSVFSPVDQLTAAEARRVTEVTYLGCVHGTLSALARMRRRDSGTIVQVGSALAYRSIPLQAAYCGAKHAVEGFSQSLRCELLHDNCAVRITMVQLPALNTPQFDWVRTHLRRSPRPVPPIFQPEVAAKAIVWAAEHAPRELKVGWPTVRTVYLDRIVPGRIDRYLGRRGYELQQGDYPTDDQRHDNLFEPLGGDHGAHGGFDADSRATSRLLDARLTVGNAVDAIRRVWPRGPSRRSAARDS